MAQSWSWGSQIVDKKVKQILIAVFDIWVFFLSNDLLRREFNFQGDLGEHLRLDGFSKKFMEWSALGETLLYKLFYVAIYVTAFFVLL